MSGRDFGYHSDGSHSHITLTSDSHTSQPVVTPPDHGHRPHPYVILTTHSLDSQAQVTLPSHTHCSHVCKSRDLPLKPPVGCLRTVLVVRFLDVVITKLQVDASLLDIGMT